MNQIVKELRTVKDYTNKSIQHITQYVNKFAEAVNEDTTAILKNLKSLSDRIGVIEDVLKIEKPNQIDTTIADADEKIEDTEAE